MNKTTKGVLAATAAGALLLGGGGTLASWNDAESVPGGEIKSGKLSLALDTACTDWVLDAVGGGETFVPGVTLVVPGDVISRTCKYIVNASGLHLSATVDLATPTFAGGSATALVNALDADASFTLDHDPTDGTPAVPVTGGDALGTSNDGDELTAVVSVTFDSAVTGTTAQDLTATLDALSVTLTQSHA